MKGVKIHCFDNSTETEEATDVQYAFQCPGCEYLHAARVKGSEPVWGWNNDLVKPTFTPSIMVWRDDPTKRCHSFVTDGKIQFLTDSFHHLKGQTVELPDWDDC